MKKELFLQPEYEDKLNICKAASVFANNSTKEEFANKILEIIEDKTTDFEKLNDISFLCRKVVKP